MNRVLVGMFASMLLAVNSQAQDAQAARRALDAFARDPLNTDALKQALAAVQSEPAGAEAGEVEFYLTKGDVYAELAGQINTRITLDLRRQPVLPTVDLPAVKAFDAYSTALEKAAAQGKRDDVARAVKNVADVQGALSTFGVRAFESKDFGEAYQNFSAVLKAHEILKAHGKEDMFRDPADLVDYRHTAGIAALHGQMLAEAGPIFDELYKANYDNPDIYGALYTIKSKGENANLDAAYLYLKAGRERYPQDVSLLAAEINHFLATDKLDEAIPRLKVAIQKEPNNVGFYVAMGAAYDALYQRAYQGHDLERAGEYFAEARNFYDRALEKDPKKLDALYSIGTLYYNRAARTAAELSGLADDFSSEGVRKFEAKKADVLKDFDLALPYFQRADSIDPNDVNTLTVLMTIYARKDDQDASNRYKARLEAVRQRQ